MSNSRASRAKQDRARGESSHQGGFVLAAVLVLLLSLAVFAFLVLVLTRSQRSTNVLMDQGKRAQLGLNSALESAQGQLLLALESDSVVIGLGKTDAGEELVVAWYWDEQQQNWQAQSLASGLEVKKTSEEGSPLAPVAEFWKADLGLDSEFGEVSIPSWGNLNQTKKVAWQEPSSQGSKAEAKAGELRVRYAWWVEDLGGLVDLASLGVGQEQMESDLDDQTSALDEENPWGRKVSQLPLYALFRAEQTEDLVEDAAEDWLLEKGAGIEHPATAEWLLAEAQRQGAQVDAQDLRRLREFSYLSAPSKLRAEAIPRGLAVTAAGEDLYQIGQFQVDELLPKVNLNALIAEADVEGIAQTVEQYLPEFAGRRGAFPEDQDYLRTLAASLVDYADADFDASTGVTQGKQWRGVDSMPFVNEIYLAYHWLSESELKKWRSELGEAAAGERELEFVMRTFVELWNPSDQEITGVVGLQLENSRDLENLPGAFGQVRMDRLLHPDQLKEQGRLVFEDHSLVSLPPNGFAVFEFVVEQRQVGAETVPVPARFLYQVPPAFQGALYDERNSEGASAPRSLIFPAQLNTESRWELSWNGVVIDRPHGGFEQTEGLLRDGWGKRKWKGVNSPALDWRYGQFGDPRATWYIEDRDGFDALGYIWAGDYSRRSNWGGRADKRFDQRYPYEQVWLSAWPDGGRSSAAGWVPRASRPPAADKDGSDARLPNAKLRTGWNDWPENAAQFPRPERDKAPVHIANYADGQLRSLLEWGQVFDPAGWVFVDGQEFGNKDAYVEVIDEQGSVQGVPNASGSDALAQREPATKVSAAAGGYTLALGREEFAAFDRPGWRSAQLLDVFTLGGANLVQTEPVLQSRRGKININTAPMEVLQVLFADLVLHADPSWGEIQAGKKALEMAQAIVRWRMEHGALRSLSELNQIKDAQGRWFGAVLFEDKLGNDRLAWARDAVLEELMAQLYNCLCVRSENFRLHALAEVYRVLPNGRDEVLARESWMRELQIEAAQLDENGLDQGGKREVKRLYDTILLGDW